MTHFWRGGCELLYRKGILYGVAMNLLFKYDVRLNQLEVLDEDARLLAIDGEGGLYFARTTALYRMQTLESGQEEL
ncbi:hypothetical protein D3C73_1391260 [compost metagenome]